MGYRNYIASIKKTEYDRIKNFTKDELYKDHNIDSEDDYVGVYDIVKRPIYEFGKYVEEFDKKLFQPVFLNRDLQRIMTKENDFYIVDKDFLKAAIDRYHSYIKNYYTKMYLPFFPKEARYSKFMNTVKKKISEDENEEFHFNCSFDFNMITQEEMNAFFYMTQHIKSMWVEWCVFSPYNLNGDDTVSKSTKYEYALFELIKIYKTFDWENNVLIYYGH